MAAERAEAQAIDQDQGTLPLLTVCTVEEVTYTQPVEPPVQEVEDSTLLLGEEKVLSQGTPGLEERTDRVTYTMGQEQSRENMSRNRLAQATPTQVAVGTAQGVEGAKGRFLWPLRGRITSPFGGRQIFGGENFHRGLDIAAPSGTPIAASAGGQVIWAGPKGTYGNLATALPPITPTAPSFWSRRATRSPRDKPSPLWAPPAGPPAPTATLNCFGRTSFWTPSFVYLDNLPDGAFPVPSGKFFSSSFHFFCKRRCTAPFFPGISKFLPQVPCHLAKTRPFPTYNASFLSLP